MKKKKGEREREKKSDGISPSVPKISPSTRETVRTRAHSFLSDIYRPRAVQRRRKWNRILYGDLVFSKGGNILVQISRNAFPLGIMTRVTIKAARYSRLLKRKSQHKLFFPPSRAIGFHEGARKCRADGPRICLQSARAFSAYGRNFEFHT